MMDDTPPLLLGSATPAAGDAAHADDATRWSDYVGNLWVPDPEQPHGWRDIWVRRQRPRSERPGWRGLVR